MTFASHWSDCQAAHAYEEIVDVARVVEGVPQGTGSQVSLPLHQGPRRLVYGLHKAACYSNAWEATIH
eukprot:CAMPEP_0206538556 /NCGR_PEP_ID=MMETSP0325_2-20121206/7932_1 /ASSEMBLY_ACC=CAM_ASM_000347 /TAXON_ID=2866 /ORGANISM="Crypthecodinium cohnii, Strain Seligo" /LENGTH=67 /DNA_ID=CAMNT_0054036015 /DNA_START=55 /DNA_END=259 /DNA_ORIENTATION=-